MASGPRAHHQHLGKKPDCISRFYGTVAPVGGEAIWKDRKQVDKNGLEINLRYLIITIGDWFWPCRPWDIWLQEKTVISCFGYPFSLKIKATGHLLSVRVSFLVLCCCCCRCCCRCCCWQWLSIVDDRLLSDCFPLLVLFKSNRYKNRKQKWTEEEEKEEGQRRRRRWRAAAAAAAEMSKRWQQSTAATGHLSAISSAATPRNPSQK